MKTLEELKAEVERLWSELESAKRELERINEDAAERLQINQKRSAWHKTLKEFEREQIRAEERAKLLEEAK